MIEVLDGGDSRKVASFEMLLGLNTDKLVSALLRNWNKKDQSYLEYGERGCEAPERSEEDRPILDQVDR
jgi:hypothetical protein